MDMNFLRGIATIVVMSTFMGICWWAYIYRSKDSFNEAAHLPFADEQGGNDKASTHKQPNGDQS